MRRRALYRFRRWRRRRLEELTPFEVRERLGYSEQERSRVRP